MRCFVQQCFQPFLSLAEFQLINETQRTNVVEFFILPFLRRNSTGELEVCRGFRQNATRFELLEIMKVIYCVCCVSDAGCVSSANSSTEWLLKNFGSFAGFVSLTNLLSINRDFDPVCIFTCDIIKEQRRREGVITTNITHFICRTFPLSVAFLFFCVSLVGGPGLSVSSADG